MPHSQYRVGNRGGVPDFFLATPSFSGRPCSNYTISLCDTAVLLAKLGKSFDYWLHAEDCHVDDARNFLVGEFVKSGAPYLVFIDDDVGWDADSMVKLLSYQDADIVGGVYPLKQQTEDYPVRLLPGKPNYRKDGLLEVSGIATGYMRVSREVVLKLMERRKHMTFLPKNTTDPAKKLTIVFERMLVEGKRWSGDLNFCREARELGFKVWVDPEMGFSHQGYNRWEGKLGNFVRRTAGVLDPQLDEAMKRLITGDDSIETFNQMFASYRDHHSPFCAGPQMLHEVYKSCRDAKGPIFECGSGLTSLVAGIAVQRNGQMVHCVEHDLEWWRQMRHLIGMWQIRGIALHYCPLKEYDEVLEGRQYPYVWYDFDEDFPDKFDVFVLDGPPGKYGREGVFKQFMDRIKDASVWIVDDMERDEYCKMVTKYAGDRGVEIIGSDEHNARRIGISRKSNKVLLPDGILLPVMDGADAVFSAA